MACYAIYVRTAAGGSSAVEAQLTQAKAAISGVDGPIKVYRDVDVAGVGDLGPGLTGLLTDLKAGAIDHLVVTDWTRLGRTPARIDQVRAALESAGCCITVLE